MSNIKGETVSAVATVQVVQFTDAMRGCTLVNDDADNAAFYRNVADVTDTFQGTATQLRAMGGAELLAGEAHYLAPPVSSIQMVCATALDAEVRVIPGVLASSLNVDINAGDLQIGAVEIKDHDGTDRAAVNASNELAVSIAEMEASGAGGYIRQDSTDTIAKEGGGNLAAINTALGPYTGSITMVKLTVAASAVITAAPASLKELILWPEDDTADIRMAIGTASASTPQLPSNGMVFPINTAIADTIQLYSSVSTVVTAVYLV